MGYAIRFVMAWTCFGLGVTAYRVADFVHDILPERMGGTRPLDPGYTIYVKAAGWSDYWQATQQRGRGVRLRTKATRRRFMSDRRSFIRGALAAVAAAAVPIGRAAAPIIPMAWRGVMYVRYNVFSGSPEIVVREGTHIVVVGNRVTLVSWFRR